MNTRRLFTPLRMIALAFLAACGSGERPAPIDLSKYDRSCTADADCIAVEPDPCALCSNPSEAINKKGEATFTAARNTSAAQCPDQGPVPPCAYIPVKATCKNAVCAITHL